MISPLNLNTLGYKPENVAIISDPHLNHQRDFVWEARGFDSPEHHAEHILCDLEQLGPDKLLICLGDMFLNSTLDQVNAALARITCKALFLFGNHPAGIKDLYKQALIKVGRNNRLLGVDVVTFPLEISPDKYVMGDHFYFKAGSKTYYASHFAPMLWDGMQHGIPAIVGHSHGNCAQLNPAELNFGKIVDAGVDNALKTVNRSFFWLPELDTILKPKGQKVWDHHE